MISGLRDTFLPLSRDYSVEKFEDLTEKMIEIVARVSATDRDRNSAIVQRRENTVALSVPFSISRIIVAGVAQDPNRAARAEAIEGAIQPAGQIDAHVEMKDSDTLPQWPPRTRLVGDVRQFLFDEALPRGRHVIRFNDQVGDNVELLFRSDISLGWSLRDPRDAMTLFRSRDVEQGAAAPATAPINRPLRIDVDVFDRLAKQIADPGAFPQDAIVDLVVRDPGGGERTQRLALAPDRSAFTAPITFDRIGDYAIRVRMRLPGFVTTESAAVNIRADDRIVEFNITVQPQGETGRDYRQDGSTVVLTPKAGAGPAAGLARVTITPTGARTGELDLSVAGLPQGLDAVVDGRPIAANGTRRAFQSGRPIVVELQRTPEYTGVAQRALERSEIRVTAQARAPREGSVSAALRVEPTADPPQFILRGPNKIIQLDELEEGRQPLEFEFRDVINPGAVPDGAMSARLTGPWATGRMAIDPPKHLGDGLYRVTPSIKYPRWPTCCLFGLFGLGDYRVHITYRGDRPLSDQMPFRIEDRDRWTSWYCWMTALFMLCVLYLLGFAWYRVTATHFPANASLMFERNGGNMPDREALRYGFNWTTLKALAWPYYLALRKTIRQRFTRSELDLVFEAETRDSALVWPKGDQWPPFTLNGQPLSTQGGGADGRPIEPLEMNYGDPFGDSLIEQRQEGLVVTLVKGHEDFPGNWLRFRQRR